MKRKVEYITAERDKASDAHIFCRRQLEEAHNKTKENFARNFSRIQWDVRHCRMKVTSERNEYGLM